MTSVDNNRPLKVFPSTGSGHRLCHAHTDRDPVPQGDDMRGLYARLTQDDVDAWLDKAKLLASQTSFPSVNPL